jgi:hypothetical protein
VKVEKSHPQSFIGRSRFATWVVVVGLFSAGIGLRLVNLTNPPLDFHAWRQLRAATIARGFYYQWFAKVDPQLKPLAIDLGSRFETLEPRLFESLVAATYVLIKKEVLWVARLYTILFWMIGGLGVHLLAKRMTSLDGAVVALAAYLFMPYGVSASRSFQPDPIMVIWVIWAAYAFYRWSEVKTWKWAVLAGILGGIAVLIKVFAVFPVSVVAVLVVLSNWSIKDAWKKPQIWLAAALMVTIPALYYLMQVGNLASGYVGDWVTAFRGLLIQPSFYVRWLNFLHRLVDLSLVFLGLISILLLPRRGVLVMLGLWFGFLLLGMSVPSLIITHDYYNLLIIPLVALSLAPVGHLLLGKIAQQPKSWQVVFIVLAVLALGMAGWLKRNEFVSQDYHQEVLGWIKIGKDLPTDGAIIGITQDYGTRLQYYGWRFISPWPSATDQQMNVLAGGNANMNDPIWEEIFYEKTQGYAYFLVTNFDELERQPVLERILSNYSFFDEGGYRLYDLREQKP